MYALIAESNMFCSDEMTWQFIVMKMVYLFE